MKKSTTVVKEINKMFPAANPAYPICFIRDGENTVIVTGESYAKIMCGGEEFECPVIDYYGEFTGGYPNIDKKLEEYAEKNGFFWEWENPGGIALYKI